jgi:lambda repressor-like predicted transcriptional regulator
VADFRVGPPERAAWFSLPLAPAAEIIDRRGVSWHSIEKKIGVNAHGTRRRGRVSLSVGERIAELLDLHPALIWPDDWMWLALVPRFPSNVGGWQVEDEPDGRFCGRDRDAPCWESKASRWYYQDWTL